MGIEWKIDTVHSTLGFRIKLLRISTISGFIREYHGTFLLTDDWEAAQINVEAPVAKIDTGNTLRNEHLQGEYWFDAEKYPNIRFESTRITKEKEKRFSVEGQLTLKGKTRPMVLKIRLGGTAADRDGVKKIGLSGVGTIKREDYGIAPNLLLPTGGPFLSDKVKVRFDIQLAKA